MSYRSMAVILLVCLVSPVGADDSTKVLLIGKDRDHPPRSHEYMFECELLAKCLRQTRGVEAVVSDGWPVDPKAFDNVDAIVLYTAMGGDVLHDPARKEQVADLLKRKIGLVALHWGTGASVDERGDALRDSLGGFANNSFTEIPIVDSAIRPAQAGHPIARGWVATPMRDEYYIKNRFRPEIEPVIVAAVDGVDYPVGWTYLRPDGGRSFGYVCGHFHDCFKIPAFRRSAVNGILWAAGVEVPAGGAPVELTQDDLELPPDPREQPAGP